MTTPNSNRKDSLPATEDATLSDSIHLLVQKIDSLEHKVSVLQRTMQEAPGMAAMATDMVDEALHNASQSGIDINKRIHNTAHLVKRLTDDNTVESLQKILDLSQEAPGLLSMIADMIDSLVQHAASSGIDLESRFKGVVQLLTQLTNPSTMEALQKGASAILEAPGMVSMVTDMVDEQMGVATSTGVDIGARIKGSLTLANRLSDPNTTSALEQILEPRAVEAISALGTAITESMNQSHKPVGPIGLWKSLRDPDVQRATSFLVEIAKVLGQELK